MSVISVEPIVSRSSSIGDRSARTYTIVYRVITDNRLDGPLAARLAVPYSRGDQYVFGSEFDTGAYCTDITADEDSDDGKFWKVTCQFGPAPQLEENPFQQPWEMSLSGQNVEVPFDFDADGRPVVNSVWLPFSNALMKQQNQPILSITRNEPTLNTVSTLFANTVNADGFYGGAPGTVMCQPINVTRAYNATYGFYFPTTYSFVYNPEGWTKRILNVSLYGRIPRSRRLSQILVQGVPVTNPVPIAWDGTPLPDGSPPIVLEFRPYNRMPFSILGLN